MTFGFVDFIVIVILLLSGLIAAYRGFVKESLGLFAWIAAALAGLYGYKYLAPVFGGIFKSESVSNVISGLLIAIIILIILTILNSYINKSVRSSILSGLDRMLGFLFGLIRGGLIVIVIYIAGLFAAPVITVESENKSISPKYIKKVLSYAEDIFPKDVVSSITKLGEDAQTAYAKALTEETKKYVEETYNAADRKTLNDLFDAVVASDQKNVQDAKEKTSKTKSQDTDGNVTGTVTIDSEARKAKSETKAKTKDKPATNTKE